MDKFILQKIYNKNTGLYSDELNLTKEEAEKIFQCCKYGLILEDQSLLEKMGKLIGDK